MSRGAAGGRLRVIGGDLRGRKLHAFPGKAIRPTAERVREALFDILGVRIVGAAFLDAYAGTGAIGVEALSRGAGAVIFIEKEREAVQLLRSNLAVAQALRIRARVISCDLARAVALLETEGIAFDIIYLDPPYGGAELDRAFRLIGRSRLLGAGGIVIGEHESRDDPPASDTLARSRTFAYGRAALTIYER